MAEITRTKRASNPTSVDYQNENLVNIPFKIKANAYDIIIERLTDLYSNPLRASVRETISNAIDSTLEAGSDKPIDIKRPTHIDNRFIVRDYGVGMSKQDLEDVYTSYGETTKADDLDQIGSFGLGAKAPLSYTDTFTIKTIKDGIKHVGYLTRDSNGLSLNITQGEETDEHDGVEITINIRHENDDIERVADILNEYETFKHTIDGVTLNIDTAFVETEYREIGELQLSNDTLKVYANDSGIESILNNLSKGIDGVSIKTDENIKELLNDYSHTNINNLFRNVSFVLQGYNYAIPETLTSRYVSKRTLTPIVIELKPGYVEFTASRDEIHDKAMSRKFIYALKTSLNEMLSIHFDKLTLNESIRLLELTVQSNGSSSVRSGSEQLEKTLNAVKEFIADHNTAFSKFINNLSYENVIGICEYMTKDVQISWSRSGNIKQDAYLYFLSPYTNHYVLEKRHDIPLKDIRLLDSYEDITETDTVDVFDSTVAIGHGLLSSSDKKVIVIHDSPDNKKLSTMRAQIVSMANVGDDITSLIVYSYTGTLDEAKEQFGEDKVAVEYVAHGDIKRPNAKSNRNSANSNYTAPIKRNVSTYVSNSHDVLGRPLSDDSYFKENKSNLETKRIPINEIVDNYKNHNVFIVTSEIGIHAADDIFSVSQRSPDDPSDIRVGGFIANCIMDEPSFATNKPYVIISSEYITVIRELMKQFGDRDDVYFLTDDSHTWHKKERYTKIKKYAHDEHNDKVRTTRLSKDGIMRKSIPDSREEFVKLSKWSYAIDVMIQAFELRRYYARLDNIYLSNRSAHNLAPIFENNKHLIDDEDIRGVVELVIEYINYVDDSVKEKWGLSDKPTMSILNRGVVYRGLNHPLYEESIKDEIDQYDSRDNESYDAFIKAYSDEYRYQRNENKVLPYVEKNDDGTYTMTEEQFTRLIREVL